MQGVDRRTDGRMDGRSRDNQISRIYRLPFFLIHVSPLQALCARENSISLTAECERQPNISMFMLELAHTADNFSLYLHRLKLLPPNLGSCLVHQKLQVSFLF